MSTREDDSMSIKSRIATIFTVLVALSSSVLVSSPSAEAALNCSVGYSPQGWAWGKCLTGQPRGDKYRVVVICQNRVTRAAYYKYGNIVRVGNTYPSTVDGCGFLEQYLGDPRTQTIWE